MADLSPSLIGAGAGALLGATGGYSHAGTSTSTSAPWEAQQPYLQDLFARANIAYQNNPSVSQGMNDAYNGMAGSLNNGLSSQAQGAISNTLNIDPSKYYGIGQTNQYQGQTTQAANNPYLGMDNPYLGAAMKFANDQTMQGLMPAYNQAQNASGSFGNSGVASYFGNAAGNAIAGQNNTAMMNQFNNQANLAQSQGQFNAGLAQNDLTRNANLAQTGITNNINQYNQGQSVLNNAAFNTPAFNSGNVNSYGQLYNAASLNNNNQWNSLNNYSNLVRGSYGGTSTTPYYTNTSNSLLGGAATGAAIGSLLSNVFPGGNG